MSFSHSAYSVMGTNMAREVLKAKMMPNFAGKQSSRERVAAGNKRAKTSAWTANARLQASDTESHDSEYDEESDGQEAGEQQPRESVPRGPVTWQCPVEGCNKKNLVEGKNGKLPNLRMDKNGEIQKIFDAWWLCYEHKMEFKRDKSEVEMRAWKATNPDFVSPQLDPDLIRTQQKQTSVGGNANPWDITVRFQKDSKNKPSHTLQNVSKRATVFDLKKMLALKWSLPLPVTPDDSKSRMLRLQAKRTRKESNSLESWQLLADEDTVQSLLEPDENDEFHAAKEWQLEMKKMKMDKDAFTNMLLSERNGIASLCDRQEGLFAKVKFKGKGHEASDLRLLIGKYEEWCQKLCPVLSFDDCIEKIENVGCTVRVSAALDLLRDLETEKHNPKPVEENPETAAMEENPETAARRLSDEMGDDDPEASAGAPEEEARVDVAKTGGKTAVESSTAQAERPAGAEAEEDMDDDMFPVPEDFDPDDFEEDVGDQYVEMDDAEYMVRPVAPAAAAVVAPAKDAPTITGSSGDASSVAKPQLTEEQKQRIEINRQNALKRLKEREAAKAAPGADQSSSSQPGAISDAASLTAEKNENCPLKSSSTGRCTGPTADEQMDVLEEQQEEEEEPYLQAQVEDDFQEDEGAAYVQDFQSQVDLESTGNIAPRASLTGAHEKHACSPPESMTGNKSPIAQSSVSPEVLMPLGSQSESFEQTSTFAEAAGGQEDTTPQQTLVYADAMVAVSEGASANDTANETRPLVAEDTLVYVAGMQSISAAVDEGQNAEMQVERVDNEGHGDQDQGDDDELGLVEDII